MPTVTEKPPVAKKTNFSRISRGFREYGFQCCRPLESQIMSKKTVRWNSQWKEVLYSYENQFCLHLDDGRTKIYQLPQTRYKMNAIQINL